MRDNLIKNKSFDFAVRIVNLARFLSETNKEYIISRQLKRSGTSVGALIRESEHAESKKDFVHRLAIAQKEIGETIYWLELLKATNYLTTEHFQAINVDAIEILKLLTAIIKTAKNNQNN